MTNIETDNPIIQFRLWCYDLLWQYWFVWLLAFIIAVLLMVRHFHRRRKEWELNIQRNRRKDEEFKEQFKNARCVNRDLYEKDVVEIEIERTKK